MEYYSTLLSSTLPSCSTSFTRSPHDHPVPPAAMQPPSHASTSTVTDDTSATNWASSLLRDCARAIADKDSARTHDCLWLLNELSSPYSPDADQRLAAHFLQALFCRATGTGPRCYKALMAAAEKVRSFDAARKVVLRFQEVSPWMSFGHVASNGAILEAIEGEGKIHVIDISCNSYCTQWPTLLEALATRADADTPHLRLTVVGLPPTGGAVLKEVGQRMERFARLMGVPFEFHAVKGLRRLGELRGEMLGVRDDEAVAVSCSGTLRCVEPEERKAFVSMLGGTGPRVVTVVEEEADFTSTTTEGEDQFARCFDECLRFYTAFFDMLNESFGATSSERLVLEREWSRGIVGVIGCEGVGGERREKGWQWSGRLREVFEPAGFSEDVVGDVQALLRRYRGGWSVSSSAEGMHLKWKEEAVVWASAWKPKGSQLSDD